jgi:putative MATE family efflux protein
MPEPPPEGPRPSSRLDPGIEEADLPESPASLPSAALAVHAVSSLQDRRQADREIWRLAWPTILSQVMASAVSLIDIGMIGRLGTEQIAGVGYATQFLFLVQSILFSIGIACVALMARAIGAGEPERARAALGVSLGLAVVVALVVSGVVVLIPAPLLGLLDAPPEIIELTIPYFRLTLGSTVLFSVAIIYESGLRAAKDTRTPMWIVLVLTIVKTIGNALLIFGPFGLPRLELVGAGLATVIAQAVGVIAFLLAARRHAERRILWVGWADLRGDGQTFAEVARIALPAIIERVLLNIAIMAYFALLGRYGPAAIAAYTVGVRILSFSWIPGIGFSTAAATLVGQALGAGDVTGARRAGWRSARFALLVSIVLGILYAFGRVPLARIFTSDPLVIQELGPFMLVLALAQPLLGIHFTLGGALRGAGDTITPLYAAALGNWGFRVPLAFAASRLFDLDVLWVWLALMFDHLARSIWMVQAFRAGRWSESNGLDTPRTP